MPILTSSCDSRNTLSANVITHPVTVLFIMDFSTTITTAELYSYGLLLVVGLEQWFPIDSQRTYLKRSGM